MPKEVFFTYELVRSSRSKLDGDGRIYWTPFGPVKEECNGQLFLLCEEGRVPLRNSDGRLLLVRERDWIGLPSKMVYENSWDYIWDRFKAYWWVLWLLLMIAVGLSAVHVNRLWMLGIFYLAISAVIYREDKKSGIRRMFSALFLAAIFIGVMVSIVIPVLRGVLEFLQVIMGLHTIDIESIGTSCIDTRYFSTCE